MRRSTRVTGTPVRNVDISDEVMEGTFNMGSPLPLQSRRSSRVNLATERDKKSDTSLRFISFMLSSSSSTSDSDDAHSEHGLEPSINHTHQRHHKKTKMTSIASIFDKRVHLSHGSHSNQNQNHSGAHHHHQHSLSRASDIRVAKQSNSNLRSNDSVRNRVWTRRALTSDGTCVVSEKEEYIANTNGSGTNVVITLADFQQIWKACKILFLLMIVLLVIAMLWTYGFHLFVAGDTARPAESSAQVADAVALHSIQEHLSAFETKMARLKQTLDELESTLSQHDDRLQILGSKISRVTTVDSLTKEKLVEQIIEQVLATPVETDDDGGTPITLGSMVRVFQVKTERDDQTEAKVGILEEKVQKIESHFRGLDDKILNLKTTLLNQLEVKDPVEIERILLPVLIKEIEKQVALSVSKKEDEGVGVSSLGLSIKDVHWMIKRAIAKYDADKTGLPDLALETAGGSILGVKETTSLQDRSRVVVKSLWGFQLFSWSRPNTPRTIIQRGVVPGECWSFEGSVGSVVIKLAHPAIITGFTLEHIPKTISPYGSIDSAPKDFQVFGLMNEDEPDENQIHDYGTFTFEDKNEPLQYFSVLNRVPKSYPIVELKVLSNQGNVRHTCIYRFRVHGLVDFDGEERTIKSLEAMEELLQF